MNLVFHAKGFDMVINKDSYIDMKWTARTLLLKIRFTLKPSHSKIKHDIKHIFANLCLETFIAELLETVGWSELIILSVIFLNFVRTDTEQILAVSCSLIFVNRDKPEACALTNTPFTFTIM